MKNTARKSPNKLSGATPLSMVNKLNTLGVFQLLNKQYEASLTEDIFEEREFPTCAHIKNRDGSWLCTGFGEFKICRCDNPKLKDSRFLDSTWNLLSTFPNMGWVAKRDGDIYCYGFIGYSKNHIEFRKNWRKYKRFLEEVFKMSVTTIIDPEWLEYYPAQTEDVLFGTTELLPLSEVLPVPPYVEENEAETFDDDMKYVEFDTTCAMEFPHALKMVNLLVHHHIDCLGSNEELRDRAYEFASLGDTYGRALFHRASIHKSEYDRGVWDDIFDGALSDHKGERDINTFKWCFENIYAPMIEEQIKLEKESFVPEIE